MLAVPLATIAGVPLECAATTATVDGHNVAGSWNGHEIDLSTNVCFLLQGFNVRVRATAPMLEAVMILSHEMAHASGRDQTTADTLATDPAFQAEVAQIEKNYSMPPDVAVKEAGADCDGAKRASAVAYQLGLRAKASFALLRRVVALGTYAPVATRCLP